MKQSQGRKKGQAALEFLTTYGWMLLIVVGVIGAMTYYGFGNAKNAVPSSCYLGQNFDCSAYFVNTKGQIGLEIKNLEKKPIKLNATIVKYPGVTDKYLRVNFDSSSSSVGVGDSFIIFLNASATENDQFNSFSFSGKDKFEITLVYSYNETDALMKTSSGELIGDIINDDVIASNYKEGETISVENVTIFYP